MRLDLEALDSSPFDTIVFSEFTGLKWYQCANWEFGESHGGSISATAITGGEDAVFPRVTRTENTNGVKRYRKIFGKNVGYENWAEFYVDIIQNANSSFSRDHTAIAAGTADDDMSTKPADLSFSTLRAGPFSCDVGGVFAVWIRQELYAGGVNPKRGQDITVSIQVIEE